MAVSKEELKRVFAKCSEAPGGELLVATFKTYAEANTVQSHPHFPDGLRAWVTPLKDVTGLRLLMSLIDRGSTTQLRVGDLGYRRNPPKLFNWEKYDHDRRLIFLAEVGLFDRQGGDVAWQTKPQVLARPDLVIPSLDFTGLPLGINPSYQLAHFYFERFVKEGYFSIFSTNQRRLLEVDTNLRHREGEEKMETFLSSQAFLNSLDLV